MVPNPFFPWFEKGIFLLGCFFFLKVFKEGQTAISWL